MADHMPIAQLLECPICLEPFEDPRMLTGCFHSLCHKCIGYHIQHSGKNGLFQCPVCRKSLQIPGDKADAFPKNYFINSCMAAVSGPGKGGKGKMEQFRGGPNRVTDTICSNSDEGDDCTQPEQFCAECCEYYCKSCSKAHRKSKVSRNHTLVPVENLTDEMLRDSMSNSEAPRCLKHKDEKVKVYCSTCKCAVCSVCCHISHQSHEFKEIADVDAVLKSELGEITKTLQGLIDDVTKQSAHIDKSQQQVESTISNARLASKSVFKKVHQLLDQKDKQIDQQLVQVTNGGTKLNAQNKAFALHAQQLESLQTFSQDLQKRGTVYNRLASLPEVRSRLQALQDSPVDSSESNVPTKMPDMADIVLKHLDGLMLEEEVKLSSLGLKEVPTVEIQIRFRIKKNVAVDGQKKDVTSSADPLPGKPQSAKLDAPLSNDADDLPTLQVIGIPPGISKAMVELFFESPKKSGGGDIKHLDYRETDGHTLITFEKKEVAERVLAKQPLQFAGAQLHVAKFERSPMLEIEGIPSGTSKAMVELFFETTKQSGGGDVKKLDYQVDGHTRIVFMKKEVAERVLQKQPLRFAGATIHVRECQN